MSTQTQPPRLDDGGTRRYWHRVRPVAAADSTDEAWIRSVLADAVGRACPAWLAAERDDIVQNAMTKLAVHRREHGTPEPSRAYLAKSAYHAVVDEIRRQARRREIVALDDAPTAAFTDGGALADRRSEATRVAEAIRDCLDDTAASRRVAVLLYLEGRGPTEIARMLGLVRKQADNLVHRGLADLRGCLRGKGVEP